MPQHKPSGPPRQPLEVRFWKLVDRGRDDECWPWRGYTNAAGYGLIGLGGRNGPKTGAHRASYLIHVGTIPETWQVDHLCGNPSCVNPVHLEAVPPWVNNARSSSPSAQYLKRDRCEKCGGAFDGFMPSSGARYCRRCNRAYQRRTRIAKNGGEVRLPRGERTHCPQGHPYSGDNLIQTNRGRRCRACQRAYDRARRPPKQTGEAA